MGISQSRPRTAARGPSRASQKKARKVTAVIHKVKSGDKLYLITRRDISPGYQAVQSCHAMRQFTADHPDRDQEWFKASNYLALLSVANEIELMRLLVSAHDHGLLASPFREEDLNGEITAIAIEPHPKAAELCKGLPLAMKELT